MYDLCVDTVESYTVNVVDFFPLSIVGASVGRPWYCACRVCYRVVFTSLLTVHVRAIWLRLQKNERRKSWSFTKALVVDTPGGGYLHAPPLMSNQEPSSIGLKGTKHGKIWMMADKEMGRNRDIVPA